CTRACTEVTAVMCQPLLLEDELVVVLPTVPVEDEDPSVLAAVTVPAAVEEPEEAVVVVAESVDSLETIMVRCAALEAEPRGAPMRKHSKPKRRHILSLFGDLFNRQAAGIQHKRWISQWQGENRNEVDRCLVLGGCKIW
ncbi:hypothetical protein L917_03043, partial [Phytophthora nicotianae]